jgi:hypothetical protein
VQSDDNNEIRSTSPSQGTLGTEPPHTDPAQPVVQPGAHPGASQNTTTAQQQSITVTSEPSGTAAQSVLACQEAYAFPLQLVPIGNAENVVPSAQCSNPGTSQPKMPEPPVPIGASSAMAQQSTSDVLPLVPPPPAPVFDSDPLPRLGAHLLQRIDAPAGTPQAFNSQWPPVAIPETGANFLAKADALMTNMPPLPSSDALLEASDGVPPPPHVAMSPSFSIEMPSDVSFGDDELYRLCVHLTCRALSSMTATSRGALTPRVHMLHTIEQPQMPCNFVMHTHGFK